jgi:hypothetical protein
VRLAGAPRLYSTVDTGKPEALALMLLPSSSWALIRFADTILDLQERVSTLVGMCFRCHSVVQFVQNENHLFVCPITHCRALVADESDSSATDESD